jgi:ketosteroid isomerase-like protein
MRSHALVSTILASAMLATSVLAQDATLRSPAPPAAELPAVTLPAELDRVLRDYERAWRAGDVSALVALFSADGFVLQSGRAPVRGREAVTAVYSGQASGDLRLRALAYSASDTVGFIIGGYRYGDATIDAGKFTLTLRRVPGGPWLIFSDMDSGNPRPR